ncbi:MAG TPA: hypothetical protein VNG53_10285 [Bacteroidia bacterium]|nr:hypothetical protein [Bacteroidia bacterium]
MSKVQKFWVVTKRSTLVDILFSADMKRMEYQFKGGLSGSGIIGTFTTKNEAEKVAKMALLKAGAITKF